VNFSELKQAKPDLYPSSEFTYGVELEYADVKFGTPLPEGCQWNQKDNTIVNSTGIANDPNGKLWEFGGEINTRPTKTISEQLQVIREINEALTESGYPPVINYRCNLHIHVRVPGLSQDLESCKKLLKYNMLYAQEAFDVIEQIPVPTRSEYPDPAAYEGALKRMKRRHRSHQYMLPKSRTDEMLAATTVKEFYEGHAPLTEKGRMWFFSPREGINLRQMWEETETIEFRHFPGTISLVEMESCIHWCATYLDNVLNDHNLTPRELFYGELYKFPKFGHYDYKLECGYQLTNFDSNKKADIARRIEHYKKTGEIVE
jgi:hypothetical protein